MSYRELRVWQLAMDLVESVYRLTASLPRDERFGLTAQLRRAAVSIPSNIAEGHGRRSAGAFAHHLSIARGSVLEVETQVRIAVRLRLVADGSAEAVLAACDDVGRMLFGLQRSIEEAADARRPTADER
jgi:four helix bundle protein